MKTKITLPILLLIATVSTYMGCKAPTKITTHQDNQTDFTAYKTFAWLPDKIDTTDLPYNNEIVRNNIRNCFGRRMAERGFSVNLESPDMLLGLVISSKKKEKVYYMAQPSPYYYNRYYFGSMYYLPYAFDYYYRFYPSFMYPMPMDYTTQKREYVEGAITLNVFDRRQNKLIWSGTARSDIYDPSYINKHIHPAIEGIMKEFPIKPIKPTTVTDNKASANAGF
jgi:hypothetical protein